MWETGARVDHHRNWVSRREPLLSVPVGWVSLCADDAGCGWLRVADARFVIHPGAPGCLSNQPSGHLNQFPP